MVALHRFFEPTFPIEIDQFFQGFDYPFFRRTQKSNFSEPCSTPKIDLSESAKNYTLLVDVPGFEKEHLSLEFSNDNTLFIEGHKENCTTDKCTKNTPYNEEKYNNETTCIKTNDKNSKKSPQVTYWCQERVSGHFSRKISFPTDIDKNHVKANLKNGVLSVYIPKIESSFSKKITID